jgi:hypothetical protein
MLCFDPHYTRVRTMTIHRAACMGLLLSMALSSLVSAQPATAPAEELLGERFSSPAAGISLRPPAGMTMIKSRVGSAEVVRFVDQDRKWLVKVNRVLLEQDKPLPLSAWKDKDGIQRPGMFQWTVDQFKTETPNAKMLGDDIISIPHGQVEVGIMAAQYELGLESNLLQQALIRSSDLQYYLVSLTVPAPRDKDLESDPMVQTAVQTFRQMIDSVELIDQSQIREDQENRLFRTRSLYVNLTESKLRSALVKEQWFRYIRDGKDIGYSYVIEEVAHDLPRKGKVSLQVGPEGVLVGVRTRMIPEPGFQSDGEAWLFCTFDRKYEAFSNISYTQDPTNGSLTSGELGTTRKRIKPIPDANADVGQRHGVDVTEEYRLEVTKLNPRVAASGASGNVEPIVRDLPPYYLPQAMGQLLPRLLPLNEQKTYLFASWISEAGEVVYRYVDVGREQDVNLNGKKVRAVPISDRIGLEGSVTKHYIAPDGKYLGTVNEASKLTILATDAATLQSLWQNSDLTRPADVAN